MTYAKAKVRYVGRLEDGTIFDQTEEDHFFTFNLGKQEVIPAFETTVISMQPGEKKSIVIPANQAYGDHMEELVSRIEREFLPKDIEYKEDSWLQLEQDSNVIGIKVLKVEPDHVTLDANHPLAGKTLHFDIELVELL